MTLLDQHRQTLEKAISPEIIDELGIYSSETMAELPEGFSGFSSSIVPAWCAPWHYADISAGVLWQIRVPKEHEEATGDKYLTPPGSVMPLGVHPRMRDKVENADIPIIIQEGTKGYLAATSALVNLDIAVVGITGCWGWSRDGLPVPDFLAIPWNGREVYLSLDADRATNRHVFDGVKMLSEVVLARSAGVVRYVTLPANGTNSIDDYLATFPPEEREVAIQGLLDRASEKIGRAPARPKPSRGRFFDEGGALRVEALAGELRGRWPMALAGDDTITVYDAERGVYRKNPHLLSYAVLEALGDSFRRTHLKDTETALTGQLAHEGLVLPIRTTKPVLNVANGMLDLATGELHDHDPAFLSHQQIPVPWDEFAGCPRYEEWAKEIIGPALDDLEEVMSTMLDQSRTPAKAALLHGPSRSGKSTLLRLMAAMVGPENVSAVTLHQLSEDRFASANLYGKMLNVAADISADHVRDLSLWKMLTGEDQAQANRKYGAQFAFTNTALMAFSCNVIPTVGEASSAYLERMKPFFFGHSYAGKEDRTIELAMYEELPGILVRLVRAYQRLTVRGQYLPTDPEEARRFENASNRVRRWISEEMEIVPVHAPGVEVPADLAMTRTELHRAFNFAAERDGEPRIGLQKFGLHIAHLPGVEEVRRLPDRIRALNIIRQREGGGSGQTKLPVGQSGNQELPAQNSRSEADSGNPGSFNPLTRITREQKKEGGGEESHVYRQGGLKTARSARTAPVAFDLETAGLELWSYGPGFVRLAGYRAGDDIAITADPAALPITGTTLVGHNIWAFDLLALARWHGLDLTAVSAIDTKLLAFVNDPPPAKMNEGQIEKHYSLDAVGERLLGVTKAGDIKAIAKQHGGFDQIPLDDPEYVAYLRRDVELTEGLAAALPLTDYAVRENEIARITAVMSLRGFRVDEELLSTRLGKALATRERMLERLKALGLPSTKKDGSPCRAPHSTEEGRAAIVAAFAELGVELPLTAKGSPALGQEAMDFVAERFPEARRLAETVKSLNGVRSIYETVSANLVGGRVHPQISLRQATGRWSVTKPGLTVMGKRGGRHIEREIFVADEGEILIAADLSQVDARAIAALCQDRAYLALFEPGIDAHAEVARMVWGDPGRREDAKAIGHGWNYGMGPEGITKRAGVSLDTAHQFDQAMRERFPDLVRWRMEVRSAARAGELLDNGFGRKMRPDPERAHTQGPALMGQGCARDILMHGLLRMPPELWPMLRAVVHDEVVLSVPIEIVDDVETAVVDALSFPWAPPGADVPVQIVAGGIGRGRSWGEVYAKEVKV